MRARPILALVLAGGFLAGALSPGALANTYYVATNGHNDSGDGSENNPWATITFGIGHTLSGQSGSCTFAPLVGGWCLQPDDVLLVRGGTYDDPIYYIPGGTDGHPVTIMAYPGEQVILRPTSFATVVSLESHSGIQGLDPTKEHHIVLDGFIMDAIYTTGTINGQVYSGEVVGINEGAHNITIKNSEIKNALHNNCMGIGGTGNQLLNLDVHDCGGNDHQHGIYAVADNTLIENCSIHDTSGYGIHFWNNGNCSPMHDNIIRYNTIYGNKGGSGIILNGASDIVHDNVSHDNAGNGILIDTCSANVLIYDNVAYGNGQAGIVTGTVAPGSTGTIIVGNICYGNVDEGIFAGQYEPNPTREANVPTP